MEKLIISGEIGWEVQPRDVRAALDRANGADIDIHLASPGGFVSDGLEIYNMIRDYKRQHPQAQLMLTIKGLAASMASYIAMNPAFDLVTAEDNAILMIHNAIGGAVGDYRDMSKMAEILDGVSSILGQAYSAKTGKSSTQIRELMDAESWFFGAEIKDAGFIDEIIPTEEPQDKASALAGAKVKFSALAERLSTRRVDLQQVAAHLSAPAVPVTADNNPATKTREKPSEVLPMNLAEFLAQNPAAKAEHDTALASAHDAGFTEGKQSMQEAMTAAGKYLGPDAAYPAPIKSLAVDVLNGKKSVEALETTVAAFDALKESQNSQNAAAESNAIGNTQGQQQPALSTDGVIRNEADFQAEIARARADLGMEVK